MLSKMIIAGVARVTLLTAAIFPIIAPPGPARAEADVLATVDGEAAVTFEDVSYYLGKVRPAAEAGVTAADVEELVETLVNAKILLYEAEARGYEEEEWFKESAERFRSFTLREMRGRQLLEGFPAREEDIRAFYEMGVKWRKDSRIITKNRERAEAAYRELENGRPWEEVADEYSISRTEEERSGSYPVPLVYDGLPASKAAYETPVGEYTPPVPDNDGIRWDIYRVDKIIHGTTDSYEKGRAYAKAGLENAKLTERYALFLEKMRPKVPVERNGVMWRDLQSLPFAQFHAKWGTAEAVASNVGGVAVTGGELAFTILDYFTAGPDDLDQLRVADPADFAYVTERLLQKIEGSALLEVVAQQQGLDQEAAFLLEYEKFRADLLTEKLIEKEFEPTLPPPTDEKISEYYQNHLAEFQIPEKLELYLVAMPERGELLHFYEKIIGGADLVDEGEAYNLARALRVMDMYQAPTELPPEEEEWLGVVHVYREPNAADPDRGLAAEHRPRAFPFTRLKELSDIFQLRDGRWGFYAPIYYQPFRQKEFDELKDTCRRRSWQEYLGSEEAEELSLEWLASLRSRYIVDTKSELYEEFAVRLNAIE